MPVNTYIDSINNMNIFAARAKCTASGQNIDDTISELAISTSQLIGGAGITIDDSNNKIIISSSVPHGPTGPQGPCGPSGNQGVTGSQGPCGPSGNQGVIGSQGDTGDTGAQGPCGPSGSKGVRGSAGATGVTGAKGPCGPSGNQGPCGPSGNPGVTGSQGTTGVTGAKGPCGPSGNNGPCGPSGYQGPTGAKGPCGPSGAKGPCGPGFLYARSDQLNATSSFTPSTSSYVEFDSWTASNRGFIAVYWFTTSSTTVIPIGIQFVDTTNNASITTYISITKDKSQSVMFFGDSRYKYSVRAKAATSTTALCYWYIEYVNLFHS